MYITFPFNFLPMNGVFLDFDTMLSFSYTYSILGLNIVISASYPSFNCPFVSNFNSLAGVYEVRRTRSKYPICFGSIKFVILAASAVSNPIIPFGAWLSGFCFSSSLCGAWSVMIASMVPSCKPFMIASLSSSSLSGGFILALVPDSNTSSTVKL